MLRDRSLKIAPKNWKALKKFGTKKHNNQIINSVDRFDSRHHEHLHEASTNH